MNTSDVSALILPEKFAAQWTGFQKRQNHVGHIIGVAQLTDVAGVFFPSLTVEIEVKAGIVTNECLFQFSLRQRVQKMRMVVYQLVGLPAPEEKSQ